MLQLIAILDVLFCRQQLINYLNSHNVLHELMNYLISFLPRRLIESQHEIQATKSTADADHKPS